MKIALIHALFCRDGFGHEEIGEADFFDGNFYPRSARFYKSSIVTLGRIKQGEDIKKKGDCQEFLEFLELLVWPDR